MKVNYLIYFLILIVLVLIIIKNYSYTINNKLIDIGTIINLNLDNYNEFIPQNISLIRLNDKVILGNIRYINYRMIDDKIYVVKNNQLISNGIVNTKNATIYFNNNMDIISDITFMDNKLNDISQKNNNILGLEDIRLFTENNIIKYIATSTEYSYNDKSKMVIGDYNIKLNKFDNNSKIYSPNNYNGVEKNWIPVNNKIIYNWYPLQIGELDNKNKLVINKTIEMPIIFNEMRGSTNYIEYNGKYLFIVHKLKFIMCKRVYIHHFVLLEKDTFKLLNYSDEFIFIKQGIEYCLSMILINKKLYMFISINDMNPVILNIDVEYIDKLLIN